MILFHIVPFDKVWTVWEYVAVWIKAACSHGRIDDYKAIGTSLHMGDQYFMSLMEDGTLIGVIVFERLGDRLHIISIGGDGLIRMKAQIIAYWEAVALAIGCTSISFKGRIGWKRVLKEYEFIEDEQGNQVRFL